MPTPNRAAVQPILGEDGISVSTPVVKENPNTIRVRVYLPLLEEDTIGVKVDQSVMVSINGDPKTTCIIMRGEWVDVTVPVFIQLKNRFPNI